MTRIAAPAKLGLVARVARWYGKRKFGKALAPTDVLAHHPRILRGVGSMEMALAAARVVPARLKDLAGIRAAMMVGCPF